MNNPFEELNQKLDLILNLLQKTNQTSTAKEKEWGGVEMACGITGYAPQTIYIKTGRGEMPHVKRDGRLWFNRKALLEWIASGKDSLSENLDYKKEEVSELSYIKSKKDEFLDVYTTAFISVRLRNTVREYSKDHGLDVVKVSDLVKIDSKDFKKYRNVGSKTYRELVEIQNDLSCP